MYMYVYIYIYIFIMYSRSRKHGNGNNPPMLELYFGQKHGNEIQSRHIAKRKTLRNVFKVTFDLGNVCLGIGDQLRPVRCVESVSQTKEVSPIEDDHLKLATLMEGYVSGAEEEEEDVNEADDFEAEHAGALKVKTHDFTTLYRKMCVYIHMLYVCIYIYII